MFYSSLQCHCFVRQISEEVPANKKHLEMKFYQGLFTQVTFDVTFVAFQCNFLNFSPARLRGEIAIVNQLRFHSDIAVHLLRNKANFHPVSNIVKTLAISRR